MHRLRTCSSCKGHLPTIRSRSSRGRQKGRGRPRGLMFTDGVTMPPPETKKHLPARTKHVHSASANVAPRIRSRPEGKIAMAQANLRLVDGTFKDRSKVPSAVLSQMACAFGNGSIIGRGNGEGTGFATIETSGPGGRAFRPSREGRSQPRRLFTMRFCTVTRRRSPICATQAL